MASHPLAWRLNLIGLLGLKDTLVDLLQFLLINRGDSCRMKPYSECSGPPPELDITGWCLWVSGILLGVVNTECGHNLRAFGDSKIGDLPGLLPMWIPVRNFEDPVSIHAEADTCDPSSRSYRNQRNVNINWTDPSLFEGPAFAGLHAP